MSDDLFPSNLLKYKSSNPRFVLRPLNKMDYHRGFLLILKQLTEVGEYDESEFLEVFDKIQKKEDTIYIVVVEDKETGKVVGCGTIVLEQKFIRKGSKTGHIEDVVVDKTYRGYSLGKLVVEGLMKLGEDKGCYKILLDCTEENVEFYKRCGMQKKEVQMVKYLNKKHVSKL